MEIRESGSTSCEVKASSREVRLVIVPTGGMPRGNPWLIGRVGEWRLLAALKALEEHSEASLAITGGKPNQYGLSEAFRYAMAILSWERRPSLEICRNRLFLVDGRNNNTLDDIVSTLDAAQALGKVALSNQVIICTSKRHYKRIEPVVWARGYTPKLCRSKERCQWSFRHWSLGMLVRWCPGMNCKWTWWMRLFAYYSAQAHLRNCRAWARKHVDDDALFRGDALRARQYFWNKGVVELPDPEENG